jgi:hypothetical protein
MKMLQFSMPCLDAVLVAAVVDFFFKWIRLILKKLHLNCIFINPITNIKV